MVVLIVEDNEALQEIWELFLKKQGHQVLQAFSVGGARRIFQENKGTVSLVAMDACVPGNCPNTLDLTKEFRAAFSGPMVAISARSDYRSELIAAGCDHQCDKDNVVQTIEGILKKISG